jgi:hypothetical protein
MQKLYRMIAKAALSNHPVLILEGNGGTIYSLLGSISE